MHPDWLGSPQHFVAGVVLAFVAAWVGRRWISNRAVLFVFAVSVTALGEIAVELVEYPLMYAGKFHYSAYYDTLADLADTMAGAVLGAALGVIDFSSVRRSGRVGQ
jgi:uncharacterized membrane protein YjdF